MKPLLLFSLLACLLLVAACHPKNVDHNVHPRVDTVPVDTGGPKPLPNPSPAAIQENLVAQYQRGEIEQCTYQNATVYRCSRNAPDAGSEVYNAKGERIGRCYFSTNVVDPVCKDATGCKVIYRMANNIWGKPAVAWVKPE